VRSDTGSNPVLTTKYTIFNKKDNMNVNNIFLKVLVVFSFIFSSIWIFNHINAWVGIGVFVLGLYISAKLIFKTKK
jgi:hypothetical protein